MPAFDIVSEVDMHEAANAVDQANRELETRFDFRGADASFELANQTINLVAAEQFQLRQMFDILLKQWSRRGGDVGALDTGKMEGAGKQVRQRIDIRQGIDRDSSKEITRLVKTSKLKVQTAIQGDKIRVTGKKKNDLQEIIALIKATTLEVPVQFNNFRD